MRKFLVFALAIFSTVASAERALIRARVDNGTRQEPGEVDAVTVYRLQAGMQLVHELGPRAGEFVIEELEVDPSASYLVQVASDGVHYNELVRFSESMEYVAEVHFTVYDVIQDWRDVEVTLLRIVLERDGSVLRAHKLFIVENRTDPPRTLYDPEGTFRFGLPGSMSELHSVTVSSASGIPVPQPTELSSDSSTYSTSTAFKPGATELTVVYDVDYETQDFALREEALYGIGAVVLLVSPTDIDVSAGPAWKRLAAGPSSRFLVLRREDVPKGDVLDVALRGGARQVSSNEVAVPTALAPHGTVMAIPDPSARRRGIVVALMVAALAFGLLATLHRPA